MYFLRRSGKRLDTKFILWLIFLIQLLVIGLFLLFNTWINHDQSSLLQQQQQYSNVHFVIENEDVQIVQEKQQHNFMNEINYNSSNNKKLISKYNFAQEFYHITNQIYCFREGTIIESNNNNNNLKCNCKLEYHGVDCGQPEIIWRAFMTSKIPINVSLYDNGSSSFFSQKKPHNIFYIIHTTTISLETLEMQIMELIDLVDLFILCDYDVAKNTNTNYNNENINNNDTIISDIFKVSLKYHIKTGFMKNYMNKIIIILDRNCKPKNIYKKFKRILSLKHFNYNRNDVILFSKNDEILNKKAIKYFKWYNNWPQPVKFRFKYIVYGYYWQHPESTIVGSALCQINMLEDVYNSDPERLLLIKKIPSSSAETKSTMKLSMRQMRRRLNKHSPLIVGDLNHFGGWYCEYCYHPINIIKKFQFDKSSIFQTDNHIINEKYIENLIANGLYIDGKLGLIKLHRYSDKYYTPSFMLNKTWKYENYLTNIYANYDDIYEE